MKVAVTEFKKGYGKILYLSALVIKDYNPILDSKYIIIDKKLKSDTLSNIKK